MQRLSTTALLVVLCVACGSQPGVPPSPTVIADVARAAPPPAVVTTSRDRSGSEPAPSTHMANGDGPEAATRHEPADHHLPPSPLDGNGPTPEVEPRVIAPPADEADAEQVATYVAELWGNTGPTAVPWRDQAAGHLTPQFRESLARALVSPEQHAAEATALESNADATASGERVTVTLEQLRANADVPWRVLTVELLVVEIGGRWLVASLEVLA